MPMLSSLRLLAILWISCTGCASLGPLNPLRPLERKLIFHPTAALPPQKETGFESVFIPVTDATQIHGVFLSHPHPQVVVLYCHGNAGHIVDCLPRLRQLRKMHDIAILGFDYCGFGASDGAPDEAAGWPGLERSETPVF